MKIKQGTKIRVEFSHTAINGLKGVVVIPAEDEPGYEMHRIKLENGETVLLYEVEFQVLPEKEEEDRVTIADSLHTKLCHWDHTDQCAYYYGPTRRVEALQSYLPTADALLEEFPAETVIAVLDVLNKKG